MTVSLALSSALSGLNAMSRASEVVASNVANALTEGYGRRELQLSARVVGISGQGVKVNGVLRHQDIPLLNDRRQTDAQVGYRETRSSFFLALENRLGQPTSGASLSARIASLDKSLIESAARPDSEAALAQVAEAARQLVRVLNETSDQVQAARTTADRTIAADVAVLNARLAQVADLNAQIRINTGAGRDPSPLIDQRQQVIDSISEIVPLRQVADDMNMIKLYTPAGGLLLDGKPAVFGFEQTGLITAPQSIDTGALSGLTINGVDIAVSGENSLIAGGRLAANFAVRDETAVEAQAKLDALARDLVERFQDPAVDPTLAIGDAGLFTDQGHAFDSLDEIGLSGRLRLNAAVDPAQGGQLWRLRDGINAAAPGSEGEATLLNALNTALNGAREPVSGGFMAGARSFSVLAGDFLSSVTTTRLSAEADLSFSIAKQEGLIQLELEAGVDTDAELQQLLLIEQAYNANAKIITMIDEMVNMLMEL